MNITCLSTSISPITHQLGTVGNESIVNSEDVRTPLGVRKVPVLSGNAIRQAAADGATLIEFDRGSYPWRRTLRSHWT